MHRSLLKLLKSCRNNLRDPKLVGIVAVAVTFAICGAAAEAQQPKKAARIGYLDPSTSSSSAAYLDAFRQEMGKLGWIEGKNIVKNANNAIPSS